ncbi:UbiD family decarboxylase [Xylaria cf. heliscus]|nr:UbiD family decarboxylase [Xylaria cf. heliscus]
MSLTVLPDEVIANLLENLTREEAERFQDVLKTALHEYSTATQGIDAGLYHQPPRTSSHSARTGATTLFMPATSPAGHGVKVVTLSSPHANPSLPTIRPTGSLTLYTPNGNPIGFLHAQTLTAFRTALASSCLLTKRATVRTLTVFGAGLQAYWHIRLALMLRGTTIRTVNIINRQFSENAKAILRRFYAVPAEVKEREGWDQVAFSMLTPGYGEFARLQKEHMRAADVIYCCTPSTEDLFEAGILTSHEGRKKGRLIVAVGSYTRDMRELPREVLAQATRTHQHGHLHYHKHATEGGVIVVDTLTGALEEAGEIIDAGLEPKQLVEIGELIMIRRLANEEGSSSRPSTETDSLSESIDKLDFSRQSSAMSSMYGSDSGSTSKRSSSHSPSRTRRRSDAGGSSNSGLRLPSFRHHKRTASARSAKEKEDAKHDEHLARWLSSGNVVYKSVGLGLMDLVVGLEVVKLANARGVGTRVENFVPVANVSVSVS